MDRCALFVDAGYALADGAALVHGTRNRDSVSWDHEGLVQLLGQVAADRTGLPLLRCYWYDVAAPGQAAENETLADLPGLKLRLRQARPGRKDGAEAEIRKDLTALARNRAVSDVVIVSFEDDLAPVVAEVQELGVRVVVAHLGPAGPAAARALRQECDDLLEVSASHLRPFVDLIAGAEPPPPGRRYREPPAIEAPQYPAAPAYERPGQHGAAAGELVRPAAARPDPARFAEVTGHASVGAHAMPPRAEALPPASSNGHGAAGNGVSGYGYPADGQAPAGNGASGYGYPADGQPGSPAGDGLPGYGLPADGPAGGLHAAPSHGAAQRPGAEPRQLPAGGDAPYQGDTRAGFAAPPQQPAPYGSALSPYGGQPPAVSAGGAVQVAHSEGFGFGEAVARDAPALWLEAVLARKPRMPSDLEARLLQGSALPIDSLLHDDVRHALRRGFWDALEHSRP